MQILTIKTLTIMSITSNLSGREQPNSKLLPQSIYLYRYNVVNPEDVYSPLEMYQIIGADDVPKITAPHTV